MKLNHIISTKQFLSEKKLDQLFVLAAEMEKCDLEHKLPNFLAGKILATVFYEPSTRTRFSFETAIYKTGGNLITTESASHFSSTIKGESLSDTMKIIGGYADAIVLRHSVEGSAALASKVSAVPIINAGDGAGEHPTQALLDVYTIKKELGKIDGLKIALIGDLLYGRTTHSLVYLLSVYKKLTIYFISPDELKIPAKYKKYLTSKGVKFQELSDLSSVLSHLDVLYVTRIQKERFATSEDYDKVKDMYTITGKTLQLMKERSIIMHPLPRVKEIATEVDNDARAAYFRQAKNGLYIRMALLKMIFG